MFEKVKKVLVDELGINADKITLESDIIDDLGADSLSVMQVIMALEDEFGISVEDEDVTQLRKVGNIVSYLESHVK